MLALRQWGQRGGHDNTNKVLLRSFLLEILEGYYVHFLWSYAQVIQMRIWEIMRMRSSPTIILAHIHLWLLYRMFNVYKFMYMFGFEGSIGCRVVSMKASMLIVEVFCFIFISSVSLHCYLVLSLLYMYKSLLFFVANL